MKKFLCLFVFFNFYLITKAQVASWEWATCPTSGIGEQEGVSVATDNSGNVYAVGGFGSSLTFGSTTLTGISGYDPFIVKYDDMGNVLWAKSGQGFGVANYVTTDASGNSYVTGYFTSSTLTFGSFVLTGSGSSSVFIVKYDPSGNVLWAKRAGAGNVSGAYSVAAGLSGDVFITGYFYAPTITFGSFTLTNTSSSGSTPDMFIAKYDVSGTVTWASKIGGTGMELGTSVAIATTGEIYVSGIFSSTSITIGSDVLSNAGTSTYDFFLCKFNSSGTPVWAKKVGGTADDKANSIDVDASGNIYLTGQFWSSSLTFGSTILTCYGAFDVLLLKYDSLGNVLWARKAGGSDSDIGYSVSVSYDGVYLAGSFGIDYSTGPSTLFIGSFTLNAPAINYEPMFVAKYDTSGTVLCASEIVSGGDDQSGVSADASGNAYVVSDYITSPFIIGSDTLLFTTTTGEEFFIAKYSCGIPLSENEINKNQLLSVYPNPCEDEFTLLFNKEQTNLIIKIIDVLGKEVDRVVFSGVEAKVNTRELNPGIYFIQIIAMDKSLLTQKVVVR